MSKKSKQLKKWAKKHGYKLKKIKLTKRKPEDLKGFPTLKSWSRPDFGSSNLVLWDELRTHKIK